MQQVMEMGMLDKVFILVGVGALRSAKSAEWMRAHVPGVHIPDTIIRCLTGAEDPQREGRNLCIELIQEIRELKGDSGVHVMIYHQHESVAEVIDRSGAPRGANSLVSRPQRTQHITARGKACTFAGMGDIKCAASI